MRGSHSSIGVGSHVGGGSSVNIGGGGSNGPCGACKFLRRKCVKGCIFAPYFESERGMENFAVVHRVFGASNVSKMLMLVPPQKRPDAIITICYEAQARLYDPIYGCVGHIFTLQQQVANLQAELSRLQAQLAVQELSSPTPLPPPSSLPPVLSHISNWDLPPAFSLPATFNLATFLDPPMQPPWSQQQQQQQQHQMELQQLNTRESKSLMEYTSGSGDL